MSEERRDQDDGNGINPIRSIINGNSYDENDFRSLQNRAFRSFLKSFEMVELGSWARDSSSLFNDANRSLEKTDRFIRSNMFLDLVVKNRETNLNEGKQVVDGGELQSDHGNPTDCGHKDEILGLDGLQNCTEGLKRRRLTEIHDVDMTNEIEDVSTGKSSNTKETLEEDLGNENNGTDSRGKPSFPSLKTNTCGEAGPSSLSQCLTQDKEHETSGEFYHQIGEKDGHQIDSFCGICAESGDLVCCFGCPSTFHQSCLGTETLSSGIWYCKYCLCKFCGLYCKQEDNLEGFSKPTTCRVCDQKYHQSCLEVKGDNIVHSEEEPFCGNGCKVLSERLEKLVGVKREMEDGFSWSIVCRNKNVDSNASQIKPNMVDCDEKLAGALFVLNKAFRRHYDTGIDMVHSVVYSCGSNFPRLDRSGFMTAILEKNDEIVSAATIRIHGNQLAEMPYVATLSNYRRQGMLKRLLNAIESALSFLNVELLVVPATKNMQKAWTDSLGFERLGLRNKRMIKDLNLMAFIGTVVLQKKIPKLNFADEENLIPVSNLRRSTREVRRKQLFID